LFEGKLRRKPLCREKRDGGLDCHVTCKGGETAETRFVERRSLPTSSDTRKKNAAEEKGKEKVTQGGKSCEGKG